MIKGIILVHTTKKEKVNSFYGINIFYEYFILLILYSKQEIALLGGGRQNIEC